jgi:two-component system sensor kinase FixL
MPVRREAGGVHVIRSPQDQNIEPEPAPQLVDRLEALRHRMTALQNALTAAPPAVARAADDALPRSLRALQLPTGTHSGRPAPSSIATSLSGSRDLEILTRPDAQQLLDAASEGFLVTTRTGMILQTNSSMAAMLRIARDRLIGQPLVIFLQKDERREFQARLFSLAKASGTCEWRVQLRAARGASVPATLTLVLRSTSALGCDPAFLWSVRGAQDLGSAKEQRGTPDADLLRLARLHAVGDMLGGLTHELSQPLSAIVNYARGCVLRLRAGELASADLGDVLGRIAECALGMAAQLRRVNDLAQEGAGERVPTDLNAIVQEVAAFAGAHARQQGCTLHVALAPWIPHVPANRVKIGQVVLGALRTCIALGKVPRLHEIWLRTACHDGTVDVIVSHSVDDDADDVNELPATALPYGLQLELARSRVIAEEHGARLAVHMNADAGARVRLALPVRQEPGP